MDEIRLKKVEIAVHNHTRRLEDHERMHAESRKDILMLQDILKENQRTNELISELSEYAQKTYEVFEPLAKVVSKTVKIGAYFAIAYHAIKLVLLKISVIWS